MLTNNSLKNHPPTHLHPPPLFSLQRPRALKLILRGKRKTFRFGGAVTVQQRVGPRGSIVRQEAARRRVVVLFVVIGLGTVAKSSSPEEESKEGEEKETKERERERKISTYTRRRYLHLVIIQRASLRESHVEEGTCVGRSARGGRGREEAGEQCRGIETAREKATDVISSSWKSGLRLGGIRIRGHFCIEFSFVRGAKDEVEWKRRARNYSKFPSNGAKLATGEEALIKVGCLREKK